MKFASFDLEIMREIPEGCDDWWEVSPFGISCAAVAFTGGGLIQWHHPDGLSTSAARNIVFDLMKHYKKGFIPLTWNGCAFDFRVLAQESGCWEECAVLAMNHVDMMCMVTFRKGWYVGLQQACNGAGIKGKLKKVMLNDGTVCTDMTGAKAPRMWKDGEYTAVLDYLKDDVLQPLELAETIEARKKMQWINKRGVRHEMPVPKMLTVKECFEIPEPDVSWMDDPPKRADFVGWMK
jgi:hypothetical protein